MARHHRYDTALVTGASSGLGWGLALQLAARGAHVVAAARRKDRLDQLCAEIAQRGGSAEALPLDCSDGDATYEAVRALDDRRPLDLVIANAGAGHATPAYRPDWPTTRKVLELNLVGAAATLHGALPGMLARRRGHLVGMASVAGFGRGLPKLSAYCASKAGLVAFMESLRVDLDRNGIDVTTVCPGFVRTEMTAQLKRTAPFIVERDAAVEIILRGLDRRVSLCSFPLPVAAALRTLRFIPDPVYDRIGRLGKSLY
jgi:short-subunit dehydrogenase